MTLSWLLAAVALALCGDRRSTRRHRTEAPPAPTPGRASSPRTPAGLRDLRSRAARRRADPAVPLALDLLAVALRSGQPVERALLAAAPAAGACADALTRVARLLHLGADPADAWSAVVDDPGLGPVAAVGRRSAHSGVRLADGLEALAADLRAQARRHGLVRAHRAGVLSAAPLGLCFLPAFVCVGIAPALIGLAGHLLG